MASEGIEKTLFSRFLGLTRAEMESSLTDNCHYTILYQLPLFSNQESAKKARLDLAGQIKQFVDVCLL